VRTVQGYAVVVLNPNYNEAVVKRKLAIDSKQAEATKAKPATATRGHKRRRQNSDDDHEEEEAEEEQEEEEEQVEHEDKVSIPFNENGFRHIAHVWDRLITPTRFGIKGTGKVAIVAHSFGGNHALSIMQDRRQDLFSASARARRSSSIHAVAFIDSVHTIDDKTPPHVTRLLRTRARHWAKSQQPLDTPLDRRDDDNDEEQQGEDRRGKRKNDKTKKKTTTTKKEEDTTHADGCARVSAGSDSHDHCPSACIDSVFGWLAQQTG
jgi:pimeloyl-ACP methyl ester carboxylesterase